MKLLHRVSKLERSQAFRGRDSVMTRFCAALDETALRLTGRRCDTISGDPAMLDMVIETIGKDFVTLLSAADLSALVEALEEVAFGGDAAAIAQARAEAIPEVDSGGFSGPK